MAAIRIPIPSAAHAVGFDFGERSKGRPHPRPLSHSPPEQGCWWFRYRSPLQIPDVARIFRPIGPLGRSPDPGGFAAA